MRASDAGGGAERTSGSALRFLILGPLEVLRGDGEDRLPIGPPLQRTLLATLILEAPRSVPTAMLLDRLWPDGDAPATATKSIQKYVSNLRKQLGGDRVVFDGGYRLQVEADEIDATGFERALEDARSITRPRERLALLDDALDRWRGEPFADLVEPLFLEPVRRRLDEVRLAIVEERLAVLLDLGSVDGVIAETEELLVAHPLRERLWQHRVAALAAAGRQAEALESYQQLRTELVDRLGIDPSPESRELERRVLLQEPTVSPAPAPVGNLPAATARLIGRDDELHTLAQALEDSRIVTLTGPGGVGKTTLAVELARRRAPDHPDGAWLVELGHVMDPERVPGRLAEALGVHEGSTRPIVEHLGLHLADRDQLLVIDNCEHVVEAAAALLGSLLQSAPGLAVIATSRERLGVSGETVVPVDPLPVPPAGTPTTAVNSFPAVELLAARAREAGASIDEEDAAANLASICRHLDGIPLAIELAAARLRALSPAELDARLDDRFTLLTNVRRDAPSRHQTLETTIDWSFQLLPEPEQTLFLRLAVFHGPFGLEATERICGSDGLDVASALAGLVDRSLVTVATLPDGSSRYRMLGTICQFAEERLGSERGPLRAAHGAYFAELAGEPTYPSPPPDPHPIIGLSVDYENLRVALGFLLDEGDAAAALRLAVALTPYWSETGALTEGQGWVDRALAAAPDPPDDVRVRALLALSLLYQPTSSQRSLEAATQAFELSTELEDERLAANAARALGRLHAMRMEPDLAIPLLEQARATLERIGDDLALAECLESLGVAHRGSPDGGVPYYREAIARYRLAGVDGELAHALFSMAYRSLIPAGELAGARAALHECLTISIRLGRRHTAAHAMAGFGQLARLAGDDPAAAQILGFALREFRTIGDRRCTARMLTALGRIATNDGRVDDAWGMLRDALVMSLDVDVGLSGEVAETVDALVLAGAYSGRDQAAATWLGAVDGVRTRHGLPRPPADQAAVDGAGARLSTTLGHQRFRALRNDGTEMTMDQVLEQVIELD